MSPNRRLAAIMFTDIEGYTALMQRDEKYAVTLRKRHRDIFDLTTEAFGGELIQYYGDGTLSIFNSSIEAVKCAIELQTALQQEPTIPVRIGIHIGDILRTDSDIIGDAVNVASRIESLGVAGSILISDKVNDALRNQNNISTEFLDAFDFKNVNRAMPVYAISNEGLVVPELSQISGKTKERVSKSFKKYRKRSFTLLILLLAVIAALVVNSKWLSNNDVVKEQSIAVLPFDNMSKDEDSEMFTDGVTEDILLQLSKIKGLQVTSRSSSMHYKSSEKPISKIAKELGVSYVLDGSVRKYGDKVRINAQLIDVNNNKNLWAENYDKTLTEIFDIQSQVSHEIAKALRITLSANEETSLNRIPTENQEAYKIYKNAQQTLNRGGGRIVELEKARNLFEQAIDLDPNFCRAYIGLADTYLDYIYWGRRPPKEVLENALTPALKALEISPAEGGSYGALGAISFYRFERETAVNYLEKALEINPSYVGAYDKLAWIKLFEGKLDEALALFEKVLELDPLSFKYLGDMGLSYYYSHEFDKGIINIDESLSKFPNNNMLLFIKAYLLTGKGKYNEAIKLYGLRSDGSKTNWMLGYAYGMSGQKEKALEILNYQLEKNKTQYVPPYMIATIYIGLGDKENALFWLEKDYQLGGQGLFFWGLKKDIKFTSLQNEPRFKKILQKIK